MMFTKYKIVQYPDGKYAVRQYYFFGLIWSGFEYDTNDSYWWSGGNRYKWSRFDTLEDARKGMMRCGAYDHEVKEIE